MLRDELRARILDCSQGKPRSSRMDCSGHHLHVACGPPPSRTRLAACAASLQLKKLIGIAQ